jgi:Ca2+-binding EF-hand superfamily protein
VRELFRLLNKDRKDYLNVNDFRAFLGNIDYSEDHLRQFIHNYDYDKDYALSFDEFATVLKFTKTINYINEDKGNSSEIFNKLLIKEFELISNLAKIAKELLNSKDFTTYEAFLLVQNNVLKYIDDESLKGFLSKNGNTMDDKHIATIMKRLDLDKDGKVSYDEFQNIFFPIKMYKYDINKSPIPNRIDIKDELRYESTEKSEDLFTTSNFKTNNNCNIQNNKLVISRELTRREYTSPIRKVHDEQTCKFCKVKNYEYLSLIKGITKLDLSESRSPGNRSGIEYKSDFKSTCRSLNTIENKSPKRVYEERKIYSPIREIKPITNEKIKYIHSRNNCHKHHHCHVVHSSCNCCCHSHNKLSNTVERNYTTKSPIRIASPEKSHIKTINLNKSYLEENKFKLNDNYNMLVRYFIDTIKNDINSEELKKQFNSKPDVNLNDLFTFFDISRRNYISIVDCSEVLKQIGVHANPDEIKLLYKRYDRDMDSRLE